MSDIILKIESPIDDAFFTSTKLTTNFPLDKTRNKSCTVYLDSVWIVLPEKRRQMKYRLGT